MSARSNASKKSPSTTRKVSARGNAKPRANSNKRSFYISVAGLTVAVSNSRPNAAGARGPFTSVEEARSAALDELVAAIEVAERRLTAVKRATTFEQLRAASSAS